MSQFSDTTLELTVNQLFFASIYFHVFVIMDIFAAIYFRRLQNWTMLKQCRVCLYMDTFMVIYFC